MQTTPPRRSTFSTIDSSPNTINSRTPYNCSLSATNIREIYFLLIHTLKSSLPSSSQHSVNELQKELERLNLLPLCFTWGTRQICSYSSAASSYPQIAGDHLFRLFQQIKENSLGYLHVDTLLGHGKWSILRKSDADTRKYQQSRKSTVFSALFARQLHELGCSMPKMPSFLAIFASKFRKMAAVVGHKAAAYCVKFDLDGSRIFSVNKTSFFLVKLFK